MDILSDIKVLELAHGLSGAFCSKLLADQGANTIKVEPPGWGDPARQEPPFINGSPHPDGSTIFLAFNTNKSGITLDLEQTAGRQLLLKLVAGADALLEGFRPGVMERLGLGPDVCLERNPRLVYGFLSGYGMQGEEADKPAYDIAAFWEEVSPGILEDSGAE